MTDTLSDAELLQITGERTLRKRVAWLVSRGVPFRFGGREVAVSRAVAAELPQWRVVEPQGPRLDLVR